MKKILLITTIFFTLSFYAQNSYETATLTFRNGEIKTGEVKRLLGDKTIRFKDSEGKKKEYNYIEIKELKIKNNGKSEIYKYRIVPGRTPLLMKVIKEYKGVINLYAIEHSKTYGSIISITDNYRIYYLNKDDGINVIKLGSSEHIFGKRGFNKTSKKVFKDCPKIIEMIENKEFKRTKDVENIIDYYYENCGK